MAAKGSNESPLEGLPIDVKPIGYLQTSFVNKNGTPRQAKLCSTAQGRLLIEKSVFANPEHSLQGLEQFSHIWLIFWFHKNNNRSTKAKVKPPKLNGERVGVFSTRSPYRPNPIGLSLVKLESISDGCCLNLSGVDVLNGTPIFDIKPFVPYYDGPNLWPSKIEKCDQSLYEPEMENMFYSKPTEMSPRLQEKGSALSCVPVTQSSECVLALEKGKGQSLVQSASWISSALNLNLQVIFTNRALMNCDELMKEHMDKFKLVRSSQQLKLSISEILAADPRSVYRKTKCIDRLYYFVFDSAHIVCWFDGDIAEILKVELYSPELHNSIVEYCMQSNNFIE